MFRRQLLKEAVSLCGLVSAAPVFLRGRFSLEAHTNTAYSARTITLLEHANVIDMLGLFTLDWNKLNMWQNQPATFTALDLKRYQDSGIRVFHPAVDPHTSNPYPAALKFFQDWNRFLAYHSKSFARIDDANCLGSAQCRSRIGVLLGMQNSDHFRTLGDVDYFYNLGQRLSQLTYNSQNTLGSGCLEGNDTGLTPFGGAVVERMNEIGMAVDISHCGQKTSLDAIEASTKPVLVTHSNCRGLIHHPRCKSDEVIKRMAARGGVMGITSIRCFVKASDPVTLEDVLDHFEYVAKLVGVEHVGLGSDNDLNGRDRFSSRASRRLDIAGLNHPHRVYDLTEGLIRRGFSDAQIELILGGNFRRVLTSIWSS